jgi:RNA polymerase sigma factor (sigma-70 family)
VAVVVADRRLLWQLLLTLPERQRAALVLRYFHDLPDAEIARALGCREVTVRSLISRGLATLRTRARETERRGSDHR